MELFDIGHQSLSHYRYKQLSTKTNQSGYHTSLSTLISTLSTVSGSFSAIMSTCPSIGIVNCLWRDTKEKKMYLYKHTLVIVANDLIHPEMQRNLSNLDFHEGENGFDQTCWS